MSPSISQIGRSGFKIARGVLAPHEVAELLAAIGASDGAGRRGLLGVRAVATLASSARLLDLARPHVAGDPRPVRAIFFDKSRDINWRVSWHQDLTIAVRARAEMPGFGAWSVKGGVLLVHPPVVILEEMITIRLHLDDCDEDNGALRVLPGTHCLGRLTPEKIQRLRTELEDFICSAAAGDALLMRPLLLHASDRSKSGRHRRVLHIEYAGRNMPGPLDWHDVG